MATLDAVLRSFDNTDIAGDGDPEIERVRLVGASSNKADRERFGLSLVMVESRLLQAGVAGPDLLPALDRLVADIDRESTTWARLVSARLYQGPLHKDGQVIIAMRRLFQALRQEHSLRSVVLIGRFPEAQLVRRWPWAPSFKRAIGGTEVPKGRSYFAYEPEPIAASADIACADLTGDWDALYRRRVQISSIHIRPDREETAAEILRPGRLISGRVAELVTMNFEDVFWIDDADVSIPSRDPVQVRIVRSRVNPEVGRADRTDRENHIAVPDIAVSRINAYHAAVSLPTNRSATTGQQGRLVEGAPIGAGGRPQAFSSTVNYTTDSQDEKVWTISPNEFVPDPSLERRLLMQYLDRNHRFRTGGYPVERRVSGIAFALSADEAITVAALTWPGAQQDKTERARLADYAASWSRPAQVRSIIAHSNEQTSLYGPSSEQSLEEALGDAPWRWQQTEPQPGLTPRVFRYVPTYAGTINNSALPGGGRSAAAGAWLHRTLWSAGRVRNPPSLVMHGGCGSISPAAAYDLPYTDPGFGRAQNCEAILFYGGALAVLGRSKVYDDSPREFAEALGDDGVTLGSAWRRMFLAQAERPPETDPGSLHGVQRAKKSYAWNLLGDCTLQLRPRK